MRKKYARIVQRVIHKNAKEKTGSSLLVSKIKTDSFIFFGFLKRGSARPKHPLVIITCITASA